MQTAGQGDEHAQSLLTTISQLLLEAVMYLHTLAQLLGVCGSSVVVPTQLGIKTISQRRFTYLCKVHASVEGDRRHGACIVVRHAHGLVPFTAVPIQQHPDACSDYLIDGRDLLHVYRQLEGHVAQQ